jgi:hypothetical protein
MHTRSVAWGSIFSTATLLLLALLAAAPLWGPGLLNTRGGGDSPFNLLRVHQMAVNLRAGVFPVRWMPDAAYGLGYPFFSYYAALPYYLAAGCTLIGLDILSAIKLTQTLFFAAAALSMYGWARRTLHSQAGAWLAAAAYTLAPYHLVNVYVRGDSLSEFAAFAFYPLILWGLDLLAERPSLRAAIVPALAYAGLIVTHNLSAFVFSPFILLYVAILVWRTREQRRWLTAASAAVALAFGALLTVWYWLPTLAETGEVQLTAQTSGYFAYDRHFRGTDLVQSRFIFDYYTINPEHPTAFAAMGSVQAALALAGVIVAISTLCFRWRARRDENSSHHLGLDIWNFIFPLIGLLVTTWLITPLSRPVWDHLSPLQMIQFPWRILSVQAVFAGVLMGMVTVPIAHRAQWAWIAAAALAIIMALSSLAGLRPEFLSISAEEVTTHRLQLYELFTGNIGSTIRYEYLPRDVVPRPYTGPALIDPSAPPSPIPLSGELITAAETSHKPTRRTWTVTAGDSGVELALPLYYWPGWRATVDGTPVPVWPTPDSGYLTLPIPVGEHAVDVWLGRTPIRLVAELVSLATMLGLVGCGIITGWQAARSRKQEARTQLRFGIWDLRFPIGCLPFAIGLVLLMALGPRVTTVASDLTMDFDRLPYLHHNPGGVALGRWRLSSYEYSNDRIGPGDTLHVTLDLELEQPPGNVTLRLVSPAAIRRPELSAVAAATAGIAPPGDSISLDLAIPDDAGSGMYLLQLKGEAASVYLRPIWVSAGERATTQSGDTTFADGTLHLHTVEASQTSPDRLDVRLDWSATEPTAANLKISLRLTDQAGNEWARLDTQPGYGFQPTSLWPLGYLVHDRYTLPLPAGTPPGISYTLTAILYRAASQESVGEHAVHITLDQATMRPDADVLARLGGAVSLGRLDVAERARQGEALSLTAYWLAVEQPPADYVVEWRLETAEQAITTTRELAPGSPPKSWPAGAWIAGRAALDIPSTTPAGDYTLSLTLRDPVTGDSLGSYEHPRRVHIEVQERVWELPAMQQKVGAQFGGAIKLAGYDMVQETDTLRLTLHWQAVAAPGANFKFFVHVADPATARPVTQIDAMPRGSTYPTGLWVTGEVVSEELVISLDGVPSGQYDLAIGWYDPEDVNLARLPAVDASGNRLTDDRLVLPDRILIP